MSIRKELINIQKDVNKPSLAEIEKITDALFSAAKHKPHIRTTNISTTLIDKKMEAYLRADGFILNLKEDSRDGDYYEVSW